MNFVVEALKEHLLSGRESGLYFDLRKIVRNAQFLSSLRGPGIHFLFPVKSFPDPRILKAIAPFVDGFDVSNEREKKLVSPFAKENHHFWNSAPFVRQDGHEASCDFVDYSAIDPQRPTTHKKSLRVSLEFSGKSSSRFGTSLSEVSRGLLKERGFRALHIHHGFEDSETEIFDHMMNELAPFAGTVEAINLGGGFGNFTQDEIEKLVKKAGALFPETHIYFEPGRWLTTDAGLAFGKVLDVMERKGKLIVTTSLVRDGHLKWAGKRTRFRIHPMGEGAPLKGTQALITGPTCDEWDIHLEFPNSLQVSKGDIVIFENVSGYAVAWNHSFNGIPEVPVVYLGGNE